jgi:hypothetical protein
MKRLGCIGSSTVWIPGEQGMHDFQLMPAFFEHPISIATLLTVAEGYSIEQLWVHASFLERVGSLVMDARLWDIRPEMPQRSGWYHAFIPGKRGAGIDLVIPAWPAGFENESMWNKALTGRQLITQVQSYNTALRFDYRWTPGSTGTALMRAVHGGGRSTDQRYLRLDPPQPPPPPALVRTPAPSFSWIRALTEEEQSMAYLHAFDKNAMYLGACSSLELGMGAWKHVQEPHLEQIETSMPGYWHMASSTRHDADKWDHMLPDLRFPDGATGEDLWITTPVLRALIEAHYDVYCTEAYVWPEHHRVLEPWQARLRVARQELRDMPLPLSILKLTYAAGIQSLDGSWLRHAEEPAVLYRPDWRHAIVGQATANFWRNMVKTAGNGLHIVAANIDCMYVVSHLPSEEETELTGLAFGSAIGQFKVAQADVPLDELAVVFADENRSVYALSQALGERRKRERAHVL